MNYRLPSLYLCFWVRLVIHIFYQFPLIKNSILSIIFASIVIDMFFLNFFSKLVLQLKKTIFHGGNYLLNSIFF